MLLALGPRRYDLSTRALVLGVDGPPHELIAQGADLVELARADQSMPVPVCVAASDEVSVGRALSAGADLVRLHRPTAEALNLCAAAGVAVLVPAGAAGEAAAAGLPPERMVVDSLLLDVTADDCPVAATAVGVIGGARIVRTADVRGARRICDVLAAVLEAR
jgi:hypothetical protein